MTENAIIAIAIAVALVAIVIFSRQFSFKASKGGLEAKGNKGKSSGNTKIKGVVGSKVKIATREDRNYDVSRIKDNSDIDLT